MSARAPSPDVMNDRTDYDYNAYERAEENARKILRTVLPENVWAQLEQNGVIVFTGKQSVYVLSPESLTEIRDKEQMRLCARACLKLSIAAPANDRLLAEYLLLTNDEDLYCKTANIFEDMSDLSTPALTTLVMLLFVFLVLVLSRLL